jgi:hypothetical protein
MNLDNQDWTYVIEDNKRTIKEMTLPDERYRSVMWAKRFLESLAHDRTNYPRVSKKIRGEAYSILRHFPSEWDMTRASEGAPDVFQERMEPVTRLFKQYEESKKE